MTPRRSLLAALVLLALLCAVQACAAPSHPGLRLERAEEVYCGSAAVMARQAAFGPPLVAEEVPAPARLLHESSTASTTVDGFEYISIGVFTEDLDNSARYCTAAGEKKPDFQGNQVECTADDVLTEAKKNILVNQLIPRAVQLHSERLQVEPSRGLLKVPTFGARDGVCSLYTVPSAHQNPGLQGYDFVLYVSSGPTSGNTIAWALTCASNRANRPVVGMANISPRYIADDDKTVRTVAHEIAHALGFNYQQFSNSGMVEMASVRGKPSAPQLTSDNVVAAGRDHFGWSGLTSVELEDEGGAGTAYSHWKRRNLKNELMAGIASIGYYTALTMAAFEDLGFYHADYSKAEIMPWGYKAGEKLLTEKCVQNGVSQYPDMFCTEAPGQMMCTADRRAIGTCTTATYKRELPLYFQYFKDAAMGGEAELMDYCPIVAEYSNTHCSGGDKSQMPGSVLSDTARCLDSASGVAVPGYNSVHAICAEVQCDPSTNTYAVQFTGQSGFVACPVGSQVAPGSYSANFQDGAVTCPSYYSVCGVKTVQSAVEVPAEKSTSTTSSSTTSSSTTSSSTTSSSTTSSSTTSTSKPTSKPTAIPTTSTATPTMSPSDGSRNGARGAAAASGLLAVTTLSSMLVLGVLVAVL